VSNNSKITWCDATYNPVWGCAKKSPGCAHCYAENLSNRYGHPVFGFDEHGRVPLRTFGPAHEEAPRQWARQARKTGTRPRVFCGSMCDVFDDHWAPETRANLWQTIRDTPELDWLLLTKRPEFMARFLPDDWQGGYRHVMLGVSAENQKYADERLPLLLATPAAGRFVSAEPLLGPVDLTPWLSSGQLDWVIVGGESGPGARPMQQDWADALLEQTERAGAAAFFKQTGAVLAKALRLTSRKGDDPAEWPADWQQRQQFPALPNRSWHPGMPEAHI